MNEPNEFYSIREWTPLNLNERIPNAIQRGLFSIEVIFTCIDAINDFLAIGTNVGIVFLYNRNGEIQKLRTEVTSRITCVKIVDSVEYMVAAGCANGQVSVFRIQKPLPPDLNLSALKAKPVERYTIRDLHRTPVSCCEWSKNGMKLYSGDRQGVVVLTELDYQAHLSKSYEILCEAYEIVQLSVHQCFLLVSTLYRSCIVQRNINTGQWHITQIGKKDRKQLVDCGGLFIKRNGKEPLLVVGRPGLRFWFADTEGNVEKTLIFRDAILHGSAWEIPILNPKIRAYPSVYPIMSSSNITEAQNFRTFQLYSAKDNILLTHDEVSLYLLNIDRLRVEAISRGFRKIIDFCVCGKEIFVLESDRSVIRLAPAPEKPNNKNANIIFNPLLAQSVPSVLGAAAEIGLFESPVEYESQEQKINNAEECFELPPIESLNLNIPIQSAIESPRAEQTRRLQIFNEIAQMDFDQSILHRRHGLLINGRKKRRGKSNERQALYTNNQPTTVVNGIVEIGQVAKTTEDNENETKTVGKQEQVSKISSNSVVEKKKAVTGTATTATTTTHPTLIDVSFCNSNSIENQSDEKPNRKLSLELNTNNGNLAAKRHVTISPISPIAAEEYEREQFLQQEHKYLNNFKSPTYNLEYPKLTDCGLRKEENVQVQIEPKMGFNDYSSGQPVDEICQALHATVQIEDACFIPESKATSKGGASCNRTMQPQQQLQFVESQPIPDDVNSFLPDFGRIRDPLYQSPPPSGDSGTSSEWEFLDN